MGKEKCDILQCPVTATMGVIGGKWKLLILFLIRNGINRFGKMSLMIRTISKQMLTTQLREMENDGLIERKIFPEIPPRVEYYLTEKGTALLPITDLMRDWGEKYILNAEVAETA